MIIASATNDQYAQHLGVMLTSLLENTKNIDLIKIFVIDGDISTTNKIKLNNVVGRFTKEITFLTPNNDIFRKLPIDSTIGHITKETYFRVGLSKLLDKNIKKVLYLDCDLIVKEDISELWNTNIKKHVLAAVDESCLFYSHNKERLKKELGIPKDSPYFNAGVMLLNIEKWRETNTSNRLVNYLQTHPNLKYMDQDALNAVLHKEWLPLDYKWNYTTYHWDALPLVQPAIIHFSGRNKPWNSAIRYKDEYFKYLKSSKWNASEEL
ncbi:glycosyltransferase family 8 protein [Paenibacillus anseongense]|uniref:glycosyltransferase family 8 protein n=1 Tax=Paenibacillus anseongense TaxID=2682845 RepID=UPI002DBCB1D9|nr:glycosyltransferase family 8 protein [Paenibacillus anseongense]MEC0271442.1 glycosyltransferase family 8 protein [Paenibacillus anseongense]